MDHSGTFSPGRPPILMIMRAKGKIIIIIFVEGNKSGIDEKGRAVSNFLIRKVGQRSQLH
jgi:hypothetical protein